MRHNPKGTAPAGDRIPSGRGRRGRIGRAFRRFAQAAADFTGSAWAFLVATGLIMVWLVTGPLFHFSDTWQLVINTATTVITFLMVFVIQNTQNRDSRAFHTKLDELIIHTVGADNRLVTAEDLSEEQLERLKRHFEQLKEQAIKELDPTGVPETRATHEKSRGLRVRRNRPRREGARRAS